MIIVRRNKERIKSIHDKAHHIYLRLDDGTEHEIHGVLSVAQNSKLPTGPYHTFTVDFSVYDDFVRFE